MGTLDALAVKNILATLPVLVAVLALAVLPPKQLPLIEIRNKSHLREANALLSNLSGKDMTPGERDYFRVLSKSVGAYEDKHFPIKQISSLEAFKYLMNENKLNQQQMAEILGCRQNCVSEILSGARELSKDHIARLSARFKVSASLFLPNLRKAG
jgi:HTH-type transcriptional regulator / antitoxin HigA